MITFTRRGNFFLPSDVVTELFQLEGSMELKLHQLTADRLARTNARAGKHISSETAQTVAPHLAPAERGLR